MSHHYHHYHHVHILPPHSHKQKHQISHGVLLSTPISRHIVVIFHTRTAYPGGISIFIFNEIEVHVATVALQSMKKRWRRLLPVHTTYPFISCSLCFFISSLIRFISSLHNNVIGGMGLQSCMVSIILFFPVKVQRSLLFKLYKLEA